MQCFEMQNHLDLNHEIRSLAFCNSFTTQSILSNYHVLRFFSFEVSQRTTAFSFIYNSRKFHQFSEIEAQCAQLPVCLCLTDVTYFKNTVVQDCKFGNLQSCSTTSLQYAASIEEGSVIFWPIGVNPLAMSSLGHGDPWKRNSLHYGLESRTLVVLCSTGRSSLAMKTSMTSISSSCLDMTIHVKWNCDSSTYTHTRTGMFIDLRQCTVAHCHE